MNIKIHDDQNTLIYRQDEYCQNFLLPQVPASFHTALLWGVMFSRAPVKWFPHSLGPKALGEGIMCLFYFGACSFASQDLHLSPGPSRILFSHAHSLQRIPLPQASPFWKDCLLRPISLPALFLWSAFWSAKTEDFLKFLFTTVLSVVFLLVMILVQSPLLSFTW